MKTKVAERMDTYAVLGGELVVNGLHLAISPKCVRLCLLRHGLDPEADHERLPARVGRHILRMTSFVLVCAMNRTGPGARCQKGDPDEP